MMRSVSAVLACLLLGTVLAHATLPVESLMQVELMPDRTNRHVVALSDFSIPAAPDGRAHFIDTDSGKYLGFVSTGYWYSGINLPATSNLLISPETYFSRGTRGKRTDVVTFYDGETLEPIDEVEIPPKRFTAVKMQGTSLLTDDDRFLVVLNFTPAASVTVVDVEARAVTDDVDIPGCFNIYPTGDRSFMSLCGNGSVLMLTLSNEGKVETQTRTEPLFDVWVDPITVSGVRDGANWHFVSKDGYLHTFNVTTENVSLQRRLSLISESERADNWRISGFQHLAIHRTEGRLYFLVHEGGPESFEDPGTHVWIYDIASGQKIDEIELERMALSIEVSQDDKAQLYAIAAEFNMPEIFQIYLYSVGGLPYLEKHLKLVLDVYEAGSGRFQRSIPEIGAFPSYIQVWEAPRSSTGDD